MPTFLDRRGFLNSSLALAAGLTFGSSGFAQEAEKVKPKKPASIPLPKVAGPDTLFLTWQRDPTTTMTIQWVGPQSETGTSIQYATLENPLWQMAQTFAKPYPNTDLRVHRCELTGLKPGTEYQFTVGSEPTPLRFRTMPAKATETFQFVSGGDAGVDVHAVGSNVLAARQEPYFVLIGGDLAYDNGRSPETFSKFLKNYRGHLVDPKGRLVPLISCPGNHEVDGGYSGQREKSPQYLSVFDGLFAETTYGVLDVGDYLSLVLLDTGHLSPIAGEQTQWLEKTLAERQERPHLIVANHVPAYPSVRAPEGKDGKPGAGEQQRKHWSPLFEKFNVDLVLEHHDHAFKRTHPLTNGMRDKYGVLYLGDGSWGKLRAPKGPEERPYLATVSQDYHVTLHRLEGDQRFHVALTETGRVADVCTTTSKRPAKRG